MKRNTEIILIIIFITVSIILALFILDFNISESKTSANLRASSYSINGGEVNLRGKIYLYVERKGGLGKIFQESLKESLEDKAEKVYSFKNLKDKFEGSFLGIGVIKEEINYNPIFPKAKIKVFVFYSSSGNSTYFEGFKKSYFGGKEPVVYFNNNQGSQVIKQGILTLSDSSQGLISIKGYQRLMAEKTADKIVQELE